jgi:hypothetical protein
VVKISSERSLIILLAAAYSISSGEGPPALSRPSILLYICLRVDGSTVFEWKLKNDKNPEEFPMVPCL